MVAGYSNVAGKVRVIDVEESVIGVVRMKREPEQTALATTAHQSRDVQRKVWEGAYPPIRIRICPVCCTMKSRPLPSPAFVTVTGQVQTGDDVLQLDGRPGWGASREPPGEIGPPKSPPERGGEVRGR